MARRRSLFGELPRTVAILAVIGSALPLGADAQQGTWREKADAEQEKLIEQAQKLSHEERSALEQAFGPDFWLLFGNPQFDLGKVLADLNRQGSSLRDAASPPRATLRDGSPCYYRNHFFERDVQGTIDVQGPDGDPLLARPSPIDRYGEYGRGASQDPGTHTFTAWCGPLTATDTLTIPNPDFKNQIPLIFANRAPVLTSLIAKVGATVVAGAPKNSAVTLVANVTDPDGMFQEILRLIAQLRPQPPPALA